MDSTERQDLLDEIALLRHRLAQVARPGETPDVHVTELTSKLAQSESQRDRLALALKSVRDDVERLKEQVALLSAPPSGYGVLVDMNDDGTFDIATNGRKMRVTASPEIDLDSLHRGAEVLLNDNFNIVLARRADNSGDVVTVQDVLDDGVRVVVSTRGEESKVVELSDSLRGTLIRQGDLYRLDTRAQLLLERLAQPEVEDLLLEEVPDVSYSNIGGLDSQIEMIADAVELPFLHQTLFGEFRLQAPKGILLYGPPGCGKTLIAKAVANSLAKKVAATAGADKSKSYFFNIKGPELLNKYVGETERQIRLIFQRAREKSEEGWPVIVFFDEMDSMFRARGTGVSSDMESTIVPQLLAELDGVERLNNVIVIGATNREDLIDPAILRPGRLDVKIKIERPDDNGARRIFAMYLDSELPIDEGEIQSAGSPERAIDIMVDRAVSHMFETTTENEFLEVTYQNGDKEVLYYKDFTSGAMIENIVRRAKKTAIKRVIDGGPRGLRTDDLIEAIRDEFRQNDDLPNTTNPDDWARISGKKGERIVFIRTLNSPSSTSDNKRGAKAIERSVSGQYL
ncbi:MAG: proteasome-associated ATPase [Actinomycetota bacterium]